MVVSEKRRRRPWNKSMRDVYQEKDSELLATWLARQIAGFELHGEER